MTLSLITTASSFSSVGHGAGYIDSTNNYFLTVATNNNFRRFNIATGAQVGTDIAVTSGAQACTLITPSSALVLTTGTSHDFIELSTGYRQVVSGGANSTINTFNPLTNANSLGYQMTATDGAGTVLYLRSVNTSLGKVASSGQTFSNVVVQQSLGATFTSIIYKGSGRYLVGDNYGRVYEIDSSGNLYKSLIVPLGPTYTNRPPTAAQVATGPRIITMSFDSTQDLLAVGTEIGIFLIQYSSREVIKYSPIVYNAATASTVLSQMVSGVVVSGSNANNSSTLPCTLREIDCSILPLNIRSRLFQSQAGTFTTQVQVNPTTGQGVQVYSNTAQTSTFIAFFSVVPRASTIRTIDIRTSQAFRLIAVDDTNGVGNRSLIFDTLAFVNSASTYSYRVPTNSNIIELVSLGTGASAMWARGRYLT